MGFRKVASVDQDKYPHGKPELPMVVASMAGPRSGHRKPVKAGPCLHRDWLAARPQPTGLLGGTHAGTRGAGEFDGTIAAVKEDEIYYHRLKLVRVESSPAPTHSVTRRMPRE